MPNETIPINLLSSISGTFDVNGPLSVSGPVGANRIYFHGDGGGAEDTYIHSFPGHIYVVTDGSTRGAISGAFEWFGGSAGNPTYSFLTGDDYNTGMYRVSEDTIGFSTGGTNRLSIGTATVTVYVPISYTAAGADSLTSSSTSKTVTIANSTVMPDTSYHVDVTLVDQLTTFRVYNKTTTTFDIEVGANSGTLNFTYTCINY